ncbi:glutamate ABC transporter substrate-binding protein [Umezawaea sp. Da 62-37]|uniref:glutamate ABC transporter substrate-binding protein n=1 Tax=Umezawaea sp. Da 62-37 TaxID=3075927 RepID=UPI0028F6DF58|nr:glutamate ABC transporter substrate-binding protein [Umezawaea sp. Da 62-37]WNV83648.1 glutamate ABC transporter substrate-binding protein [Umezawaea sp. Da 62-37]
MPVLLVRLVAAFSAFLLVGACGSGDESALVEKASGGTLTVGISFDQPGLGVRRLDGTFKGIDVDVARYVANELGVDESGITWQEAQPANREKMLTSGQVDLVLSTYSITEKRKEIIDFVGPYFLAGQDLLVRMADGRISGPESLNEDPNLRLCSVQGTTSAEYVKTEFAKNVKLVEYPKFSDCVTAVLADNADAMTSDDVILAGYAAQNPELLRVVGHPFSKEEYGIGLRKGDAPGKAKVLDAVRKMIAAGEWRKIIERNVGPSGYVIPDPPTVTS